MRADARSPMRGRIRKRRVSASTSAGCRSDWNPPRSVRRRPSRRRAADRRPSRFNRLPAADRGRMFVHGRNLMEHIAWGDFEKVLLVAGTVTRVERFPEARKPAYRIWVDFGPYGEKKTSAQVTALYAPEDLVGRQVVG